MIIGRVIENFDGESNKVQVGDKLIRLNSIDATKDPLGLLCFLMENKYKREGITSLNLELEREGKPYEVTLKQQYLFKESPSDK